MISFAKDDTLNHDFINSFWDLKGLKGQMHKLYIKDGNNWLLLKVKPLTLNPHAL